MHLLSFLLALVCCLSCSHGRSELDMLRVAFSNVEKDTIDGEVSLESGEIPHWLNGTFIRHSCGVFGETESDLNSPIVNYVDHLFDCLEMGTSFKFEDGKVSFYNRYYDTNHVDIFNAYNHNRNESKVFWKTILAEFDVEQNTNLRENITAGPKEAMIDHVTWWALMQIFEDIPYEMYVERFSIDMEDWTLEKGFLIILDARSMEVIAHVTAPDLALAGLHNNFFPAHVGHG
ncbi:hypothetical protein CAPTEDRAFT_192097 [Capitella teleta]|uniref:Uncharacterized protein n=1 Tax=Capitella teleta TaxID=283909 RepID=R7U205_CAPTE|nr:hypothetical protein CAPTEDRAFT_192097 [Capitella teleta]|eukprot:ELU00370.1 hypothetical protein CAPTEDRAFT_192097 [Capitella teleta]